MYTDWLLNQNIGIPPSSVYFDWTYPLVPLSMILTALQNVVFFYLLKVIDIKHHGGRVMEAFGKRYVFQKLTLKAFRFCALKCINAP